MPTISKQDLIRRIAQKTNTPRETVKVVVQHFLDEIVLELARNNRLELRDFGVFEPQVRQARVAMNPKTLVKVQVPPTRVTKFKMGLSMRTRLNRSAKPAE